MKKEKRGARKVKKTSGKSKKIISKIDNKFAKKIAALAKKQKPILWVEKMSVEQSQIDSQHHKLLNQLNKLLDLVKSGEEVNVIRECIHFFDGYAKEHFSYEEEYMKKVDFPGLKKHKEFHGMFVKKLKELEQEFDNILYVEKSPVLISEKLSKTILNLRKFVSDWLVHHILGADQEYHKFVKGKKKGKINVSLIAREIKEEMVKELRKPLKSLRGKDLKEKRDVKKYIFTGVDGFDSLLQDGIPAGNAVIVAGGAGSGKTIFCLQTLINKAKEGNKCLYMTLEESEDKLLQHMEDFGWPARELAKKGKLKILRINPFDITRNVDALLAKQKGELLIDIDPVILPNDYKNPDFIVIDSLTAIASAFTGKEDSYRIYIEQLFRFLEKTRATSFLITETEQVPKIFSQTGVEEFLADGVIVLYAIKHGNTRENAIEVLKLRGAAHQKKIVAMQITGKGIVVYPEQEVFSEI
jgi:hemerythrin-like metal-binding protein